MGVGGKRGKREDQREIFNRSYSDNPKPGLRPSMERASKSRELKYFKLQLLTYLLFQAYEHIVEGFELIPKAFVEMMEGVSQGKVIVRM